VLAVLRAPRAGRGEECVAAARLFVAEFFNWHAGISPEMALAAYRAGHLTVADARRAGIVPQETRWRCERVPVGFIAGPPGPSSTGPP